MMKEKKNFVLFTYTGRICCCKTLFPAAEVAQLNGGIKIGTHQMQDRINDLLVWHRFDFD